MTNNVLKIAKFAARFMLGLDVVLGTILILFMIAWPLELSFMESISLEPDAGIFKFETSPKPDRIPISDYEGFFFYFITIRAFIMVAILYRIIQLCIRIINSISSLATFRLENVQSFRQIGQLFLIWFAVSIPSIKQLLDGVSLTTTLNFKYALFALICFVLAEIFSEGNKLMEENKLTI